MPALILALLLALGAACGGSAVDPADRWLGFNYPSWEREEFAAAASDASLGALADTGSNAVAIVPTLYAAGCDASTLRDDPRHTASAAAVEHAARRAAAVGLRVALKPHVDIDGWPCGREQYLPADLDRWFAAYTAQLVAYAEIAERTGAGLLVVGTELDRLSTEEAHWRALIAVVRGHFSGALTFAANPEAYELVRFWDALDYIGIDAYFPLSADPGATYDALRAGWEAAPDGGAAGGPLDHLGAFARRTGRPVLFTEVGFRAVRGTGVAPASCEWPGAADDRPQATAYAATLDALAQRTWWAGALWWAWVPDLRVGGCTVEFSPQGRAAEAVVRERHPALLGGAPR